MLEAGEVGAGASGRNGGQVIPGLKLDPSEIEALLGPERGARLIEIVGSAADFVFGLVRRHGIECDARQDGWIKACHRDATLRPPRTRPASGASAAPRSKSSTGCASRS